MTVVTRGATTKRIKQINIILFIIGWALDLITVIKLYGHIIKREN